MKVDILPVTGRRLATLPRHKRGEERHSIRPADRPAANRVLEAHPAAKGHPSVMGEKPLSDRRAIRSHLVLIGLMGVGKTSVGRLLAARLHWSFWDNDEALEAAIGKTAAQLQREGGQRALHETEDRLLQEALRTQTPTVFAAAASVVLNPSLLGGALVVWLRMNPAMEERNIASSGQRHRPLPVDAAAVLQRMSADRVGLYGGIADIVIDVGDDAASTCERVLEALRGFSK